MIYVCNAMSWIILCAGLAVMQYHVCASNGNDLPFIYLLPDLVTQHTQTQDLTQQIADHGLDILHGLQSKQKDCFQKSTLAIEDDCQQLVSDETSQIKYALTLTLCELATAQIQVPQECQSNHSTHHLSSCIKKLASIPQTWTTYSGYYRDVVTICFAVRYPLEKELLQKAQYDMTTYQSESYQKIQQQQQDLYEWRQQEMQLLKSIQLQQSDLQAEITNLQGVSASNLLELISILQEAKHKASDISAAQKATMNVNLHFMEEITGRWDTVFRLVDHKFGSIYSKMDEISGWQNRTLESWIEWQESQDQAMQYWQRSMDHANQSITNVLNLTEHQLSDLKHDILDIHTGLFSIFGPARQLYGMVQDYFYYGICAFVLMGLCWVLPTSLVFTVLKTLILGYLIKSSFHWLSTLGCLGLMIKHWIECQQNHYPYLFLRTRLALPGSDQGLSDDLISDVCNQDSRLELYYRLLVDE